MSRGSVVGYQRNMICGTFDTYLAAYPYPTAYEESIGERGYNVVASLASTTPRTLYIASSN